MLSLMTFGAGFLMRPLGAIVLGAYTDHHGRRAGLILTLALMSVGIITIACTPRYATHRTFGSAACADRSAASGLFRGDGTGRSLSLPVRDRHSWPQRFLCQLAICKPAGGSDVRSADRRWTALGVVTSADDDLGMAGPAPARMRHCPGFLLPPALSSRDR